MNGGGIFLSAHCFGSSMSYLGMFAAEGWSFDPLLISFQDS